MIEQPTPEETRKHEEHTPRNLSVAVNLNALTAEQQKVEELEKTSVTDNLTGLPNRTALFQEAQKIVDDFTRESLDKKYALQATHNDNEYAVLILDIDHFKNVNDTYGHDAGDEVLKVAAKVLQETFPRKTDLVTRYGGEEFVIILKKTHTKEILEKLSRGRNDGTPGISFSVKVGDTQLTKNFSGGLVSFMPTSIEAFKEAITEADRNLYIAKNTGRDRIMTKAESAA